MILCPIHRYVCSVFVFFFFQAEDGIRDLVRSRGLGDVYKRQDALVGGDLGQPFADGIAAAQDEGVVVEEEHAHHPVSYTHLTLPTSDLV